MRLQFPIHLLNELYDSVADYQKSSLGQIEIEYKERSGKGEEGRLNKYSVYSDSEYDSSLLEICESVCSINMHTKTAGIFRSAGTNIRHVQTAGMTANE